MTKISWKPVIEHAREVVESYDTGATLRQLFYRLVADGSIPNAESAYELVESAARADPPTGLLKSSSRAILMGARP